LNNAIKYRSKYKSRYK